MTTPGGYSAGSIFLQVVPSFRGFQEAIRKEARDFQRAFDRESGQSGERQSRERGQREGRAYAGAFGEAYKRAVQGVQREVQNIDLDVNDTQAQRKLAEVTATVQRLRDARIGVDVTAEEAIADISRIELLLAGLEAREVDIDVEVNLGTALAQVRAFKDTVNAILGREEFEVDADTAAAERKIGRLGTLLRSSIAKANASLPDVELDVDADEFQRELQTLKQALRQLDGQDIKVGADTRLAIQQLEALELMAKRIALQSPDVQVGVDAAAAYAELRAFRREVERLDKERVEIDLDSSGLRDSLDANGSAFRAFNVRILAAAVLIPLLVPLLATLAGGIAAVGASALGAAAGVGVMVLAFSGIGDAVKAMGDVERDAGKDALAASKTIRTAGNAVRDAEQGVARARQSAADSAEDAARRVADAQRGVADAQEASARRIAQAIERQARVTRALEQANRAAADAQRDLVEARQLAEQDEQDLGFRIQQNTLDERQGVIDVFESTVSESNARLDPGATNLDREQAAIALERSRLALAQTRAEGARLRDEQARQQREGSDRVRTAQERLTQALEAQQEAIRDVGEADQEVVQARVDGARQVADAQEAVADAVRAQARQSRDAQQGISDAQERLTDAQASYAEALAQTGTIGSASMQRLQDALGKLSPAGQAFAEYLFSLRGFFYDIRTAAQEGMLPGVQSAFQTIIGTYGPGFQTFVGDIARVLGDLFEQAAQVLTNPMWQEFFSSFAEYAPIFTQQYADAFGSFILLLAKLAEAFFPFAEDFLGGLNDMIDAGVRWADGLGDNPAFERFVDYLKSEGPRLLDFLGSLFDALLQLGEGLAPYVSIMLVIFTAFLDFVAGLPPEVLGAMAVGIVAITLAVQTLVGLAALVTTLTTAFTILSAVLGTAAAPFLIVLGIALALAALFVILWTNSETFRDIVKGVFDFIGNAISTVYNNILKPIFDFIAGFFTFVYDVWSSAAELVFDVFVNILQFLGDRWNDFAETGVGKKIIGFMSAVKDAWDAAADLLGGVFGKIGAGAKAVIRFVVDTVLNDGLIKAFNWIAEKVGSDSRIDRVVLPNSFYNEDGTNYTNLGFATPGGRGGFATGGLVPGYSPTPTADNIPAWLTAGEFILPVNAVRELRRKFGDQFLEMLRGGMPGFAAGGAVGGLPGYAAGGLVEFGRFLQALKFRVGEHPLFGGVNAVHTANSAHYSGQAIDVNYGPGGESLLEKAAIDAIAHLARSYGLRTIWRTSGHFDHAHFDTRGGPDLGHVPPPRDGGGFFGDLSSALGSAASAVGSGLASAGGTLLDYGGKAITAPLQWITDQVRGAYGILNDSALGKITIGGAEWALDLVLDKAKQFLGGIGDFVTGSGGARDFVDRLEAEGYAAGGWVGQRPTLYDDGGWLQPGLTTVLNASGRPEPVFSDAQWEALRRGDSPTAGGDEYHWHDATATPEDFAEAIMFAKRVAERGGKCAGV